MTLYTVRIQVVEEALQVGGSVARGEGCVSESWRVRSVALRGRGASDRIRVVALMYPGRGASDRWRCMYPGRV